MTTIYYSKRETHNLGNYESVSVEISIEDEPEGDESKTECYERLKLWVTEKLNSHFPKRQVTNGTPKAVPIPYELPKTAANQESDVFIDLKRKISSLIQIDRANQDNIKKLLISFGVNKVSDLSIDAAEQVSLAIDNGKY